MLHVGIIGAGHFAKRHIVALETMQDRARVALIGRRDPEAPLPEAEPLGARIVSAEAVLRSLDIKAVLVCSPNNLHRAHAEAALDAGKHVFCEKPLALSTEDADALIAKARKVGRVLMVGHTTRYSPTYVATADLIKSGRLGKPLAAYASRLHTGLGREWRMDPIVGGGVAFDLMIHDFDILNWCFGRPSSVVARGHKHTLGSYDHLSALFTYPSGAVATVEGSFLLREPAGLAALLRIVCEHGHVEVDSRRSEARVFPEGKPEETLPIDTAPESLSGVTGELTEFLDTIECKPHGRLRVEDARQAVESASLAVHSADIGEELCFP